MPSGARSVPGGPGVIGWAQLGWTGLPKVLASLAVLFLGSSAEVSGLSGEIPRSVYTGPDVQ